MTTRRHVCRKCRQTTEQRLFPPRPTDKPGVEQWTCRKCGLVLLTLRTELGVIEDAEGLCIWVINEKLMRTSGAGGDRSDDATVAARPNVNSVTGSRGFWSRDRLDIESLFGDMWAHLWQAHIDFDPSRGVAFRSYAVHTLRLRLIDEIRKQLGKDGRKAQATADSLADLRSPSNRWEPGVLSDSPHGGPADDARLEHALGERALDGSERSLADLRRVLNTRRDEIAEYHPAAKVDSDHGAARQAVA